MKIAGNSMSRQCGNPEHSLTLTENMFSSRLTRLPSPPFAALTSLSLSLCALSFALFVLLSVLQLARSSKVFAQSL